MRKGMAQGLARPAYFDRNPTPKVMAFQGSNLAPHAGITRWTYTVPAGRKAFCELLYFLIQRASVSTTFSPAQITVDYQPSGGSLVILGSLNEASNVQWAQQVNSPTSFGYMGAGDTLLGQTGDGSTGGTVSYITTAKATEYDA